MGIAVTDPEFRLERLREYYNQKAQERTEPELIAGCPEEKQISKFIKLMHKQPYYPDYAEIDSVNPIEKAMSHLFSKYKDFNRSLASIYSSLAKTAEERFNLKLDLSAASQLSSDLRGLTVADWFGDVIRNKPKNSQKRENLEEVFRVLREGFGLSIPFSRGIVSESRVELALATIAMEQKFPIDTVFKPALKSESSLKKYIETSNGLLNGLIKRIKKGKIDFLKVPSLKELRSQLPELDRNKKKKISLEQMGIDFLVKTNDREGEAAVYLPIQVKSNEITATNFRDHTTIFAFDPVSFDELKAKVTDPVIINACSPRIRFKRAIPCISARDKNITDLKAELESIIKAKKKLKLKAAFSPSFEEGKTSNTDLIAAMINQGFLIPEEELRD